MEHDLNVLSATRPSYDRWAAVYDHDGNPLLALEGPKMQALLRDVRGLKVLDLGCGTGRHALYMADIGANVTGVDFSEGMLAEARRKPGANRVRFIVHDLHQPLPFEAQCFDRIVSGLVLEHIGNLANFFGEIHRVLNPLGRAILSAMHPAMFLRGSQAKFTDPCSGEAVRPGSLPHQISDFIMASLKAGLKLTYIAEYTYDAFLAAQYPRAEKYIGWPGLLIMQFEK